MAQPGAPRRPAPASSYGSVPSRAYNPAKGQVGSLIGGGGVNDQAAGARVYGQGRPFPNMGKTTNKAGYGKRDAQNEARKNALRKQAGGT